MSRAGRAWAWGLSALAAAALLVVLVVAGGDETPDVEIGPPEVKGAEVSWGEPEGGKPTGVIMLLHGGGWQPSPKGYEQEQRNAAAWQAQGYATVAVGYDVGAKGFRQIEDVYVEARRRYPDLPICASGTSAGGHLALMLATREPDLACVVDFVGPTDLTTLRQHDEDVDEAYRDAVEAFGKGNLARFSPVRYADRIDAKVLMVLAETDPVNPVEQGDELARALPSAELLILPEGPVPAFWAHGGTVQEDAQEVAVQRIQEFVDEATQGS